MSRPRPGAFATRCLLTADSLLALGPVSGMWPGAAGDGRYLAVGALPGVARLVPPRLSSDYGKEQSVQAQVLGGIGGNRGFGHGGVWTNGWWPGSR